MICDTCIYKELCNEKEEDRRALKFCSEYFNFEEKLEKIKGEIEQLKLHKAQFLTNDNKVCIDSQDVFNVIDKYKAELKGK